MGDRKKRGHKSGERRGNREETASQLDLSSNLTPTTLCCVTPPLRLTPLSVKWVQQCSRRSHGINMTAYKTPPVGTGSSREALSLLLPTLLRGWDGIIHSPGICGVPTMCTFRFQALETERTERSSCFHSRQYGPGPPALPHALCCPADEKAKRHPPTSVRRE